MSTVESATSTSTLTTTDPAATTEPTTSTVESGSTTDATTGTTSETTSASSTSTMIGEQVGSMLSSIDSGLGADEMLKAAITMLILQALLGQGSESNSMAGEMLLGALAGQGGAGAGGSGGSVFMYSETTTIQFESSGSTESGATQDASATGGYDTQTQSDPTAATGGSVDVSA